MIIKSYEFVLIFLLNYSRARNSYIKKGKSKYPAKKKDYLGFMLFMAWERLLAISRELRLTKLEIYRLNFFDSKVLLCCIILLN